MPKIYIKNFLLVLLFTLPIGNIFAQEKRSAENQSIYEKSHTSLDELRAFLSIPNDSNNPEDILSNIRFLEESFQKRGLKTKRLSTKGSPLFYAEWLNPDADSTVLFYMHFDGQPVDVSKWDQESPYKPVLKKKNNNGDWFEIPWPEHIDQLNEESRIFARSSSDDKSPIIMLVAALDIIRENGIKPSFNIKVILDSEEEKGSPNLVDALIENKDLLSADRLVILDGPRHTTNQPTLLFGARGIALLTLKTFGAIVPQHSGHYGNYVPNPVFQMAELLASMKDEEGRVVIEGFYDGIHLDDNTKRILNTIPDDEDLIKQNLQIAQAEKVGNTYQESLQFPSLNVRGIASGWVGENARTIVPSEAITNIDIRLVPETDGEKLIELVKEHIRSQGYHIVYSTPTEKERTTYPNIVEFQGFVYADAFRTPYNSKMGIWLQELMEETFGAPAILIRMTGGTVPISHFIEQLNVPAVIIPLVQPDNNQHSPNENLRMGNYIDGIKLIVQMLQAPFDY